MPKLDHGPAQRSNGSPPIIADPPDEPTSLNLGLQPEANEVSSPQSGNGQATTAALKAGQDAIDAMAGFKLDRTGKGPVLTRVQLSVPVRKPHRTEFVRVHPDPAMQAVFLLHREVIDGRPTDTSYLVKEELEPLFDGSAKPCRMFVAITRQGTEFLWPISEPDDGRVTDWVRTAREAAELAKQGWVSVRSNMSAQAYDVVHAVGNIGEPRWSGRTLEELAVLAFKGKQIVALDHPIIKQIEGE
jgi:hypothetical protein